MDSSKSKSAALITEAHSDILRSLPIGHLATIRPDGQLSVNPVAIIWDGVHVRVSTIKSRQKCRNLRRDPRVAISIPHRDDPSRYVEIRGTAELSDDADRSFVNSVAKAYLGVDEYPFDRPGEERVVITIHAEHVSAPKIPLAGVPPEARDAARRGGGK
ncbi:MAG: PPOX class F420-dependent oxidoreductase [Deltaproteobacteria bacterium]|nr:PPOX class F420-dependent oxidoreductase [Deltaproteobacteria bacterium]